eukprot:scaffold4673_cov82-Skeletonema_dohrnii-CCMP3373.AAC.3
MATRLHGNELSLSSHDDNAMTRFCSFCVGSKVVGRIFLPKMPCHLGTDSYVHNCCHILIDNVKGLFIDVTLHPSSPARTVTCSPIQ